MTLSSIIKSVRVWGVRGIINYLHRLPVLWQLAHSDKHGYQVPERGITLIGPFSSHSGNSQTMRNFASRLMSAKIPFQTFDTNDRPTLPIEDYKSFLTPKAEFDLSRYDHVIELFSAHAPQASNRVHSLLMFWEFDSGFSYAFPEISSGLPILAMSTFNAKIFKESVPRETPVFNIRYPLEFDHKNLPSNAAIREKYNIPADSFMVFFNFDYGSSYYRKNPEAIVESFAKAFPNGDENAILVFKTPLPCEPAATYLRKKIESLNLEKRTILIEKPISQSDMSGLIYACDAYISLHRGEGFGIGMAEAMSLGKSVIATDYSANTEFCSSDCTFLIPAKMVSVASDQNDISAYAHVDRWADADTLVAASALRKLYGDLNLRKEMGQRAKAFVENFFNVSNFKKSIDEFLDYSGLK